MMRLGRILLITVMLIGIVLPLSTIHAEAQAKYSDLHIFIVGPEKVPIDSSADYTISLKGGPGEELSGMWSYTTELEFEESRAGAEIPSEMESGSSPNSDFQISVNSSSIPQKMWLKVNGSSFLNETNRVWSERTLEIEVYTPVVVNISAKVRNKGSIEMENVSVSFYLDGDFQGIVNTSVAANSTKSVFMEWIAPFDSEGEHTVEVVINEESELLELDGGDNTATKVIYIGERPKVTLPLSEFYHTGLVTLLGVIGFFTCLAAFFMRRSAISAYSQYGTRTNYFMYFMSLILPLSGAVVFISAYIRYGNYGFNDSTGKGLIDGIIIFTLGMLILIFTYDRIRRKRW